jgi:hypothetical protein
MRACLAATGCLLSCVLPLLKGRTVAASALVERPWLELKRGVSSEGWLIAAKPLIVKQLLER